MRFSSSQWRRGLAGIGLVLAAGLVLAQQAAGPAGAPLPGDVNGDGQVDIKDATTTLQMAVGLVNPNSVHPQGLPTGNATPTQVQYGRYIVVSSGCSDCHNRGTDDPNDPNWMAGYIQDPKINPQDMGTFAIGPFKVNAANLTPDPATGLGNWTAQDIFNAIRTGKNKVGHYLCPPMPWPVYRNKSDDELWAVAAYLKSIKPVSNKVPEPQAPAHFADGSPDWSSAYQNVPPPFPPYPGKNEASQ